MSGSVRAALFDVDGTLVDTNYLHVVTWWQAFGQAGHQVPMADIHRAIGMGSDRLLDRMESVNAHWEELPERDQRILVMRFYGNLTQTEIGDRLGISQMHVSRLLARALAHLRSKLLDERDGSDLSGPPDDLRYRTAEGLS